MNPDGGFTVTERVDTNASVRRDFEQALDLMQAGDHEAGIELLEKVVEASPEATVGHLDLGIAYALTGKFESAQISLENALVLNPKHPVAHNELGIVHRKQGQFEDARRSYESALDVYPDFHHARRNLAILCDVYLSDMKCARKNYELYRELMPDDEAVAMWLADLQNRMGE